MNGPDSVVSVYSDARAEYMHELTIHLIPAYFQFFIQLLNKVKQTTTDSKKILWQFQNQLNDIPNWNIDKVTMEVSIINENCGCDYLEDLLTAVFIAHTKILTAIRISSGSKQKKVQITVPKVEHFLFRVLCESSKSIWRSVYLFSDGASSIERQQNYKNVEQLLHSSIQQAVRSMVPVKSILKDFVSHDDEEDVPTVNECNTGDTKNICEEEKIMPISIPSAPGPCENNEISQSMEEVMIHAPSVLSIAEMNQTTIATNNSDSLTSTDCLQTSSVSESTPTPASDQLSSPQVPPPIIIVDTSNPSVEFTDFDTVYDSENPDDTIISFEPKSVDDMDNNELNVLENSGISLDMDSSISYTEL